MPPRLPARSNGFELSCANNPIRCKQGLPCSAPDTRLSRSLHTAELLVSASTQS